MSYATFDAIKIGIASPEMIREWSYGEVLFYSDPRFEGCPEDIGK